MSSPFNNYANFYDTLYQDKNYEAECDFIESIFHQFANSPVKSILDLGCGTGGHVLPLVRRGYQLTGVDFSETMLGHAQEKATEASLNISLVQGDIRELRLNQEFDSLLAMFAVMGYQTTNFDLSHAFATAAIHLKQGGLLVFDNWHGPAVLSERPCDRVKELVNGEDRILRHAHPVLNVLRNTVDVHYKVFHLSGTEVISEAEEVHTMRFLFAREIEYYLEQAGFELVKFCPFMEIDGELTENDWNMTTIAKKTK